MEFLSYRDPVKDKAYTFLVYSTDKFNELLYKRYVKICNDENLDDCIKYTGLFEIHNNTKYFIYKINNTFIRVEDCKLARDINRWSVAKEKIKIKKNSIVKRYLNDVDFFRIFDTGVNFQELLKLNEITRNSLHVDNEHGFNLANDTYIIKNDDELKELLNEFKKLDNEIQIRNLETNKFELIKFVYDYYKVRIAYHYSQNGDYPGETRYTDIYNFISNKHISNCLGCSRTLKEIYNYYGIKADVIGTISNNPGHGILKMYLDNGKVTYIDLSREISEFFRDNERCYNSNKYDYFLKSKNVFIGKIGSDFEDFKNSKSIDICDKYGNKRTVFVVKTHSR